jgi:hypothetical protein
MRLLKRLRRKKPLTKHRVEIDFHGFTIVIVYDAATYMEAVYRVYDLWKWDGGQRFSMGHMCETVARIEASVKHGG